MSYTTGSCVHKFETIENLHPLERIQHTRALLVWEGNFEQVLWCGWSWHSYDMQTWSARNATCSVSSLWTGVLLGTNSVRAGW